MRWHYLLLAASIVFSAAGVSIAEVTIKGDGRVRYIYKDNYLFGNLDRSATDFWDSRVRLTIEAKSRSGAFAKVRLRSNIAWGASNQEDNTVSPVTDFAYIGVPLGPTEVKAGFMKSNITRFLEWDQNTDQITIGWEMLDADWTGVYRILNNSESSGFGVDRMNNNNHVAFGAIVKKDLTDTYRIQANLFYVDDQRDESSAGEYYPPASGFFWSLFFHGEHGKFEYQTEYAFKSSDVRQSRDEIFFVINRPNIDSGDGWGWYLAGMYRLGSFTPSLNIGVAANGFEADNDFGWIMVGNSNVEPIAMIAQVGESGDWFWIAPSLLYTMTEKLDIRGNAVWVSVDAMDSDDDTTLHFINLYELSVDVLYKVMDNATITWKAGLLKPEIEGLYKGEEAEEHIAFGTYCRLQVHF